jgi:hypothetical protein
VESREAADGSTEMPRGGLVVEYKRRIGDGIG